MTARLPVLVSAAACVVLFGSILFVFGLVIASLVLGGVDFSGEPTIADTSASVFSLVA